MNLIRTDDPQIDSSGCLLLRLTVSIAVLCALASQGLTASAVDQVIRYSEETTVRGEITRMDSKGITVKRSGGEAVDIPSDDIRDLRYDGEPPSVQRARSSENSGALDGALEKLKDAGNSNLSSNARVAAEIDFLTARCLARLVLDRDAENSAAAQQLQSFRSSHATNCRYFEATLWLARLRTASGESDQALSLLQELQDSGVAGFQLQSVIARGDVLLNSGEAQQALQAFDTAIAQCEKNAALKEQHRDARIGRALALDRLAKSDEAVIELDAVIRQLPEAESTKAARLWIHKGDILQTGGHDRAALLAYLHVDILYDREPAAHAEALFHLAGLWQKTGHPDRARDAAGRLKQNYADSSWAAQLP